MADNNINKSINTILIIYKMFKIGIILTHNNKKLMKKHEIKGYTRVEEKKVIKSRGFLNLLEKDQTVIFIENNHLSAN